MAAKRKTPSTKPTVEEVLNRPFPKQALKPLPHKRNGKGEPMTSITPIYVTDRMNEAFGIGGWQFEPEVISDTEKMVIVRGVLSIPSINARIVQFGGNDNRDRGDAYKGAATDALGKCCSYLGVGAHVYRDDEPSEIEQLRKIVDKANVKKKKHQLNADIVKQLEERLGKHEEQANKLLEQSGWINDGDATGQTFRDLSKQRADEVLARPEDFLAAALNMP
tara:strand:- start:1844 stop:2506 length:663 start_codon:yes stop_codon:yes gene_type:complete